MSEEEISKSFEKSLEADELTDLMGNPLTDKDLLEFSVEGDSPLSSTQVIKVLRGLQGKVLTVVDATFTDENRIKYVKDLIKESFNHTADWIFDLGADEIKKVK